VAAIKLPIVWKPRRTSYQPPDFPTVGIA